MEDLIKDGAPVRDSKPELPRIPETTVTFKMLSDRGQYQIKDKETGTMVAEISGYDLQMNFNMQYINSVEDMENALEGLKSLFREILLEQIMDNKRRQDDGVPRED